MTIFIKFLFLLGLMLGIYGWVNYATAPHGKNIYCQMTYLWVEHEDEAQATRPGWPPFDPSIRCRDNEPIM